MRMTRHLYLIVAAAVTLAAPAWAQSTDTRPASSTVTAGDTGLWFVPLGETLPKGRFAAGAARVNFDRTEGFSDISDFTGMFAFGASDKVEVFGALAVVRRIDADRRPVLAGGSPMDYVLAGDGWATGFGDVTVGAKFNIRSQATNNGPAIAIRGAIKIPSASRDDGLGTGSPDFWFDGIVSKELNAKVDVSGYAGLNFRGSPDDYELSSGFRYGAGVGYPSRARF